MTRRACIASFFAAVPAVLRAEREFDVDGPVELYIWMTAKPGAEVALEKTFRETFYPAVSSRPGFRSAQLVRKPKTAEYTVRLSFDSEDQRVAWAKSEIHDRAWPALSGHCAKVDYSGFAVVHPR